MEDDIRLIAVLFACWLRPGAIEIFHRRPQVEIAGGGVDPARVLSYESSHRGFSACVVHRVLLRQGHHKRQLIFLCDIDRAGLVAVDPTLTMFILLVFYHGSGVKGR